MPEAEKTIKGEHAPTLRRQEYIETRIQGRKDAEAAIRPSGSEVEISDI
jgi:hypothetical protein